MLKVCRACCVSEQTKKLPNVHAHRRAAAMIAQCAVLPARPGAACCWASFEYGGKFNGGGAKSNADEEPKRSNCRYVDSARPSGLQFFSDDLVFG